jgi:hypothetical protein
MSCAFNPPTPANTRHRLEALRRRSPNAVAFSLHTRRPAAG